MPVTHTYGECPGCQPCYLCSSGCVPPPTTYATVTTVSGYNGLAGTYTLTGLSTGVFPHDCWNNWMTYGGPCTPFVGLNCSGGAWGFEIGTISGTNFYGCKVSTITSIVLDACSPFHMTITGVTIIDFQGACGACGGTVIGQVAATLNVVITA